MSSIAEQSQGQFLVQEDGQTHNFAVSVFLGILSVPMKCTLPMSDTVFCFQWRFKVLRCGLLCLIGSQQSSFGSLSHKSAFAANVCKGARSFGKLADSRIPLCSMRVLPLTLIHHVAAAINTADTCLLQSSSKAIPSRLLQVALMAGWTWKIACLAF